MRLAGVRVVLDTNVLVSALGFGGKPGELYRLALEGGLQTLTSRVLLLELATTLRTVLGFDDRHIDSALQQLIRVSELVEPGQRLAVVADEPDNRVLECAIAGEADLVVSGDGHLRALGEFRGIPILTPTAALELLGRRPSG